MAYDRSGSGRARGDQAAADAAPREVGFDVRRDRNGARTSSQPRAPAGADGQDQEDQLWRRVMTARLQTDEAVELLKDLLIVQLGLADVPQRTIREIVGCDINRVSRIV